MTNTFCLIIASKTKQTNHTRQIKDYSFNKNIHVDTIYCLFSLNALENETENKIHSQQARQNSKGTIE